MENKKKRNLLKLFPKLQPTQTHLNLVKNQLIPQTVVPHDPPAELRLLPLHGKVKQSPSKRGLRGGQDLHRSEGKQRYYDIIFPGSGFTSATC